jgi:hypothetical protein
VANAEFGPQRRSEPPDHLLEDRPRDDSSGSSVQTGSQPALGFESEAVERSADGRPRHHECKLVAPRWAWVVLEPCRDQVWMVSSGDAGQVSEDRYRPVFPSDVHLRAGRSVPRL